MSASGLSTDKAEAPAPIEKKLLSSLFSVELQTGEENRGDMNVASPKLACKCSFFSFVKLHVYPYRRSLFTDNA